MISEEQDDVNFCARIECIKCHKWKKALVHWSMSPEEFDVRGFMFMDDGLECYACMKKETYEFDINDPDDHNDLHYLYVEKCK
jgi:hypothetical protein